MILPTKGIQADRALLAVGADILRLLDEPKTVSRLWDEMRAHRSKQPVPSTLSFDWFVLALDLLHAIGAVEMEQGRLIRSATSVRSTTPGSLPYSSNPIGR